MKWWWLRWWLFSRIQVWSLYLKLESIRFRNFKSISLIFHELRSSNLLGSVTSLHIHVIWGIPREKMLPWRSILKCSRIKKTRCSNIHTGMIAIGNFNGIFWRVNWYPPDRPLPFLYSDKYDMPKQVYSHTGNIIK